MKKILSLIAGSLFFKKSEIEEIHTLFKETEGLIGRLETISNTETRKVLFEKYEPNKWPTPTSSMVGSLG